ncbi:MAG: Holliday junction resolvase RuvX [Pseudomonadota bacterium]
MKIICLDVGTKRIGLAACDPLEITAQGLGVIERTTKQRDFAEILQCIQQEAAEKLLIGLPLDAESKIGVSAQKILDFIQELRGYLRENQCQIPIETWDERYSTAQAQEHLIEFEVSRKKRKKVIDKMAALMILRDYLESKV